MRLRGMIFLLGLIVVLSCGRSAFASETRAEHAADVYAAAEMAGHPVDGNLPDDALPAPVLAKAVHLQNTGLVLDFGGTAWSIVQLLLLLSLGVIAWMRDVAVRASRWRVVQAFVFFGLFTLAGWLLDLPLDAYGHHLALRYGLSVQGWGGWFWDAAKSNLLTWGVGSLLVLLLFWIIGKFPRRWWMVFWAVSIPITLFAIFVGPYVNFLFNNYEPLEKTNPALVAKLEQIVAKGHMDIPPSRMYLMKASEKVTTLNADVEGFGASKRVVVWDNTIKKMTPDEVLGVFGHESGHYVLGHIREGVEQAFVIVFMSLWLGYLFVNWAIGRFGERWGIPSQRDWGALAVLMLGFMLLGIAIQPVAAALSRSKEHAADIYGQEAIHGIVANPQAAMQGAFDVLSATSFAVPNPPQWEEFWMEGHPAIGRRAAFAHAYDPWAPGMKPKYFPPQ